MAVLVKICGVTTPADARMVAAAGADMIGLNFYPQSKRFVDLAAAVEISEQIPDDVWRVGVFVNSDRMEVEEARLAARLHAVQFHGDEPPEMLLGWPCPVIRAIRVYDEGSIAAAVDSEGPDYYLCEGGADGGFGGAGVGFDWNLARQVPARQLIVAGGLNPGNVAQAVQATRPFAVDVASGVESSPGCKDQEATLEFIQNAKSA